MFKCICLILRSRLTVTISSGNNISLHDICIVFSQMMLASLLISCFASCQHSVVSVLGSTITTQSVCYVSPSHVSSTFYICITISSHNHTAAAAGHSKHSYLLSRHMRRDSPDWLTEGCTAMYLHYIRDPWSGHIHILLYVHFTLH